MSHGIALTLMSAWLLAGGSDVAGSATGVGRTARPTQSGDTASRPRSEVAQGPLGAKVVARLPFPHDVLKVALSPDGRYLAADFPETNTVSLWDVDSGGMVRTLRETDGGVATLAYSADGRYLAAGREALPPSSQRIVNIWDARTGVLVRELPAPSQVVSAASTALAWSPTGQYLASRHANHEIGLYSVGENRWVRTFPSRANVRGQVVFRRDGRHLAFGAGLPHEGYSVRVVEVGTGRVVRTLTGCTEIVRTLAYSPDGARLAAGEAAGQICIYNAVSGTVEQRLRHPPLRSQLVTYTPDGRFLISAGADGTVRIWDARRWELVQTLIEPSGTLFTASLSGDGRRLAAAGSGVTTVWEFTTGQPDKAR